MKRLTKKLAKELLKDENYLEGLAYFCNRIMKCKTYEQAMRAKEKDYEKVMDWAYEFEDEDDCFEDYSDNFLRIDTAIFCIIEREFY